MGLFEKRFSLFASRIDCLLDLLVSHWVEETESQVFKLSANLAHAEPVRDGRIDFERLLSDLVLPLGIEMLQRAHVVQAVGQLDQDDPNVIHHGQHHLADIFGLLLFPRRELDLADLGHALDNVGDLFAELLADIDDRDRSVLDRVVQQPSRDRDRVHLHLGQHQRYFQGMNEIGLSGSAALAFVML